MQRLTLCVCLALVMTGSGLHAADGDSAENFESILNSELRRTFERIAQYVDGNPKAADASAARQWL